MLLYPCSALIPLVDAYGYNSDHCHDSDADTDTDDDDDNDEADQVACEW